MELKIQTSRLTILPFTIDICEESVSNTFDTIKSMGICPGNGWPDAETIDTLPKIIKNLNKVSQPSGFESWMIIDTSTNLLIGDIGFKGIPIINQNSEMIYWRLVKDKKNLALK